MPHNAPTRHVSGFSLIELLVVVLIVAIVAGLALPGFQRTLASNRLVSQHNELLAGLSLARSEAIRRNTPVALCAANAAQSACQTAWGRDWLVWQDTDADGTVDADETILQVGGVTANEVISAPENSADTVFRFSPRGLRALPTATTATLRIRAATCPSGSALSRTISVLPTGATRSTLDNC